MGRRSKGCSERRSSSDVAAPSLLVVSSNRAIQMRLGNSEKVLASGKMRTINLTRVSLPRTSSRSHWCARAQKEPRDLFTRRFANEWSRMNVSKKWDADEWARNYATEWLENRANFTAISPNNGWPIYVDIKYWRKYINRK